MSSFDRDKRRGPTALQALLAVCGLCLAFAGQAIAAPVNWLEPTDLSKPGRDASNPAVAMDPTGNAIAIWERQSTTDPSFNLQSSSRPVGGAFPTPADFQLKATEARIATSPSGEVAVAWKHFQNPPGNYVIELSTRPPGGAFSAPATVYTAPTSVIPQELELAIGAGGDVAVTWSNIDPNSGLDKVVCATDPKTMAPINCPNPSFVQAAVRPAGGVLTAPGRISVPRGTPPPGEEAPDKLAREKAESQLSAVGAHPAVDAAGNTVVVWNYFNGTDAVVHSATREVGQSFGAPVQVSESGENAGGATVGIDAGGTAIASWVRGEGSGRVVQAGVRPPGGGFSVVGDLSPAGGTAESPLIDVTQNGAATVVWRLTGFSETFLQVASRPPGGAFTKPLNISSGKDNPLFPQIDTNDAGDAIVVWSGDNGSNEIARASVRSAGGGFGSPVAISQSSTNLFHPEPSLDASGDATVVWVRDNGTHGIVQMAGYDADPPELRAVSIPSLATVGDTVSFSATSYDVWSVGNPRFDFGDGATADGTGVTHIYSAPGTQTVRVTARDAAGRETTTTGTILVKARNYFSFGKLTLNRKKGTATLVVTIPEPGTVVASGKGVKKATSRAASGGAVKLSLKAAGKGLKTLNRTGKLMAKLKFAYSPTGGDSNTKQRKVTLKKKLG